MERPAETPGAEARSGGQASSGASADSRAASGKDKHYAKSFWYEIAENTTATGDAFSIPYCEPSEEPDGSLFAPRSPAVRAYNQTDPDSGSSPRLAKETAALHGALERTLGQRAQARGLPALAVDRRLAATARELALAVPENGRIPYAMLDFAVRHHGVIDASPTVLVLWGALFRPQAMAEQLAAELPAVFAAAPPAMPFNHFGMASVERGRIGAGVVVVVLASRYAETEPFARQLPRGGSLRIDGNLRPPFTQPSIHVSRENGDRLTPSVAQLGNHGFRAEVSCGSYQGRQVIEIKAQASGHASGWTAGAAAGRPHDRAGRSSNSNTSSAMSNRLHTVARVPVWCRKRAPHSLTLAHRDRLAGIPSTQELEIRLANRINRERRRCGLDDIQLHDRLATIAQSYSQDVAESGQSRDARPPTRATDRIYRAQIENASVYEYVARAFSIDDVVDELFADFGYRAAILSPRTTHLGLGIRTAQAGTSSEYFMTQLFISVPSALTMDDVRKAVLARLQSRRELVTDSTLSQQAETTARDIAGGMPVETAVGSRHPLASPPADQVHDRQNPGMDRRRRGRLSPHVTSRRRRHRSSRIGHRPRRAR